MSQFTQLPSTPQDGYLCLVLASLFCYCLHCMSLRLQADILQKQRVKEQNSLEGCLAERIRTPCKFPCTIFYFNTKKELQKNLTVSSICSASPQILATSSMLHFPPRESFSTCVSLLCLYGTCPRCGSPNAITTCSRNVSDLLMYMASICVSPNECSLPSLSEPAKSTRFTLDTVYLVLDSVLECDSI